jgi:carbon monoxide dehydrogenase subunit G
VTAEGAPAKKGAAVALNNAGGRTTYDVTRVEKLIEIDAPSRTIWAVLTDPSYLPKLYPDIVTVEADPPGRTAPGQICTLTGRVGTSKIKVAVQFTTVNPEVRLVSKGVPGGLFASFEHTITLEPMGPRTMTNATFDYSLSPQYLEKVPDPMLLEHVVEDNLRIYIRNLKEICELLPLPE